MKHQDRAREAAAEVPEVDVFFDQLAHEGRDDVPVIYLVWGVFGARDMSAELRAVTSYRERAELYKEAVERENESRREKYLAVEIEETWLNHLYGHSMFRALYDIEHEDEVEEVLAEEESRT